MYPFFIHLISFLLALLSFASPSPQIEVVELEEGVYVYRSFAMYEGSLVSANGLIVESSDEVALIDTPWDKDQTIQLLEWVDQEIDKDISFTVITHAHMDRIGGIDVLKSRGIPTISGHLTAREATKNGYARPDLTFQSDTLLMYGSASLQVYYPGPGHTVDNTVVYLKDQHILYGGCFIKGPSSVTLGNLEDADKAAWPISLRNVMERYPQRKQVIPGHGNLDPGAIDRTMHLLLRKD